MTWSSRLASIFLSCAIALALLPAVGVRPDMAHAAESETFANPAVTARLISAEQGVATDSKSLSLGLDLNLGDGWKAYWRSPGEVGLPPSIDWSGSDNLASAEILWPAPERFTAFGIENFGYHDRVLLPIRATLATAGAPVRLRAQVSLLTCSDICVPQDFELTLDIPVGNGIDRGAADLITTFARRVPSDPDPSVIDTLTAAFGPDREYLIVTATSTKPFQTPDVFPEFGELFTFGKPDIRLNGDRRSLWARLPVLAAGDEIDTISVTITDTGRAVTGAPQVLAEAPPPPFPLVPQSTSAWQLLTYVLLAFVGGLILNAMPCVLPVLSIKLASVIKARDHSEKTIRGRFLVSALGVMAFMWVLSASVLALQWFGFNVGWGLQFQSPVFLTLLFLILAVFAANLFGIFEISLPSRLQTRLASAGARQGYAGDFATGAFAAILATPCSAPFLGTAVAFALTGRIIDILAVFSALGLGLALPYLAFAARPGLVRRLPKPGTWMTALKVGLGFLLALTAAWILWVLSGVSGSRTAGLVALLSLALIALLSVRGGHTMVRAGFVVLIFTSPLVLVSAIEPEPVSPVHTANWVAFDRRDIPRLVSQGEVVFVDITADWCLTCKANKALVLDREPVASLLQSEGLTAMRADWTRPNPEISRYLETHGRFGIPFNAVYGPGAPEGIVLSEILTASAIEDAVTKAGGRSVASSGE